MAGLFDPFQESQDDSQGLPTPPPPRPNLARLQNVPIKADPISPPILPYLHPTIVEKVTGFMDELFRSRVPVKITEAFRTKDMQGLVEGNEYGGVAPGSSLHEAGYAIDINWNHLTDPQRALTLELARKHGLSWGGNFRKPDPVHFYVDPFGSLADRAAAIRAAPQEYDDKR